MKVCPVCGTEYGEEAAFCSRDRSPLKPAGARESQGLVGQLVGERYQVERRLGEGGMGEVYYARHVLIGRPCALKVMSQSLSKDPDAVSRFNREATSASSISHPNVCAVYDFGLTSEGLVYLAMEYVEGPTLSAILEESGPMPVPRAAELIAQCAAGLRAAHDLGIVHRDLKPDNIMVQRGKGAETAKLVDFGIAKAVEGAPGERVTKTGFVVGTPEYMSPEQLSGDPVNGHSDQYSLALVFYRLITGRLPFEGNSLQESLIKRLTDPPRPLAVSRPELSFPAGLQAIMDRALAREAAERYPSVSAFADAVNAVVAGDALPTRKLEAAGGGTVSTIPPTRQTPVLRASRGARIAGGAVGLLALAGVSWAVLKVTGAAGATGETDTTHAVAPPPAAPHDSGRSPKPAVNPAPSPTPPAPGAVVSDPPLDTAEFDLEVFDSPARSAAEAARARRVLAALRLAPQRRAEAAAFLGALAVHQRNEDSARRMYRLAYRLNPNPSYREMLRQLRDTIQP